MKKTILTIATALTVMCTGCFSTGTNTNAGYGYGNNGLGSILGSVLGSVLFGGMTFDQSSLVGNWNYNAPSAAFTTEQTLNKAGGINALNNITAQLAPSYNSIGINKKNTFFNFARDNKFNAQVNGIPFNGTYAYNPQNGEITLKTATESIKGNVTKTQNGMGLMFDSKQMTNLLQKEGKVTDKQAVAAVSTLAKSANGARVGFEFTK
jgi:hypothetical protein